MAEWLALQTSGPFGDKLLDLSKTVFDISLSSSAFTKTVVKINVFLCKRIVNVPIRCAYEFPCMCLRLSHPFMAMQRLCKHTLHAYELADRDLYLFACVNPLSVNQRK